MARKLTKKQEKAIEAYYNKTQEIFFDEATEQAIADINWYETVYQDMNRYIWDYNSQIKYGNK